MAEDSGQETAAAAEATAAEAAAEEQRVVTELHQTFQPDYFEYIEGKVLKYVSQSHSTTLPALETCVPSCPCTPCACAPNEAGSATPPPLKSPCARTDFAPRMPPF